MSAPIVERLQALHVWPQFVADAHADVISPRQGQGLYDVGNVATEAADTITDLLAACELAIPEGFCLDNPNVPDSVIVPLDFTMGELRQIAAAIAKAKGGAA